ncbi:TPA: ParB/RepB/Spo0J family partition protein [Klebsiella quasipneumoniae]|uniref:ParB/RepB/Spo0J family partition protein n=1 Tax=Klebsiella quasipneumoniae TaxID=1463165 RepID=UPI00388EAD19|nr:ParB/RepB/Spo0J family partition protein [Klebsiella quasipneumoniae subsp. similipneumoniae]HCB3648885.1 ParB/RepB/Spo0J family partition protein [Klebsiella pneumoniae]HCM3836694.1 ParB/RepB/Spo0J family partition protein [Klebsiella quasipneumoniae]HCM5058988.1 ParB/RepB/Spo0J family partition protein [Klebsiella aerogenes]HCB3670728.1 ParB/RepB/Spo0J family partition protein [Klebsiella pneumoniae]
MSATESKVKTAPKTSKKTLKSAEAEALKVVLDAAQVEYVPVSALVKSPLNVRTIPYPAEKVCSMADSIEAIGLLQNLVVHNLPDGRCGVAAGGRRLKALQLLQSENRIDAGYQVMVKKVPDELAVAASMAENEQQMAMHPSEQIAGFRTLAEQGKNPAQIGDLLGFSTRHVQRMLKLTELAPAILEALAKNEITTEHCQALALESDQKRQVEVLESARKRSWNNEVSVSSIRNLITSEEVSTNGDKFRFVGEAAFSPEEIRVDLFSSENGGYVKSVSLDTALLEKLQSIAEHLREAEGWSWCDGRLEPISHYGKDSKIWRLHAVPPVEYTEAESERLAFLAQREEELEAQNNGDDGERVAGELNEVWLEQQTIEFRAEYRTWPDEIKQSAGVVVSWTGQDVKVQRGVVLCADEPGKKEPTSTQTPDTVDPLDAVSVPLLTRLSSERTLAVQAALLQQPQKAVALMVWKMCNSVFHTTTSVKEPFCISVSVSHYALTREAPGGENSVAFQGIQAEKERLEALLPENWRKDMTTFFTLDGATLMALMAFCSACSIDGVQGKDEFGRKQQSSLDGVENAIQFDLRDWWKPTADNLFSHMKQPHIVQALSQVGLTGAAQDAAKMKKKDAAEHAEHFLAKTRWVPEWMTSADNQKQLAAKSELSLATSQNDTDADSDDVTDHNNPACAA